tara:strand:- start:7378 stop:7656 length:279 start_codon:yes stop_codon:yes gene_type:complete
MVEGEKIMSLYDSDFDREIESRWWGLMNKAHNKGLTIYLSKGKSNYGGMNLIVKIKTNYENPKCVWSGLDLDDSIELYFKAESFINNFDKLT